MDAKTGQLIRDFVERTGEKQAGDPVDENVIDTKVGSLEIAEWNGILADVKEAVNDT